MPEISIQQNISGVGNFVVGQGTLNILHQLPELDREGYRNLAILRDKVKQFWIGGVLEKSVHGEAIIALDRQSVTEAVDHPWATTLELPDQKSQLVPSGKRTSEIFYECGRALLILGEPGSGKTVTLLETARDLIQRSEIDPTQPVPLIVNLSSWSARQPPLFAWLVEELKTKYFVSRKLAELWLQQNRLLLLLDGLDEVAAEARPACVQAIHQHIEEQGSSGIVVCCRIRDYTALPLKLKLNAAICVQPLTSEQIDQYLQHGGESLAVLRQAVNDDAMLREIAQTPLMLSIMSLAYQDITPAKLTKAGLKNLEESRQHIFEQYVEKMFLRRQQRDRAFGNAAIRRWLARLARQMNQRAQTLFLIENLQPDWLPRKRTQWAYFMVSRGLSSMLLVACFLGALLPLTEFEAPSARDLREISLFLATLFALVGFFTGTVEAILILKKKKSNQSLFREIIKRFHIYGVLSVAAVVVCFRVDDATRDFEVMEWLFGLLVASVFGTLFGLVFGVRANRQSPMWDIHTVESLTWSWRQAVRGIWRGFVVGSLIGVPIIYLARPVVESVIVGIAIGAVASGISHSYPYASNATTPTVSNRIANLATNDEPSRVTNLVVGTTVSNAIQPSKHDSASNAMTPGTSTVIVRPPAEHEASSVINPGESASAPPRRDFIDFIFTTRGAIVFALLSGFIGSIFGAFFSGLVRGVTANKTRANQGILLSFRKAVWAGAPVGLFLGFWIWAAASFSGATASLAWAGRWGTTLIYSVVSGLFLGSAIALWYGGFDIIQHYTLRLLLWRSGYAPRRLVHFLDHAADLIFLQRVGGGYIFIHRLLLEHFAATESKCSAWPLGRKP